MLAPAEPLARVLVVDDEAALVTALCDMLNAKSYAVRGLTSAREALDVLRRSDAAPFDVLLTDLSMPEMDGVALLRAALEIDPDLVGIIMTGQATVRTAVEAMKIGASDYILKPLKLNVLLGLIARAVQLRRLRSDNIQLRAVLSIYELSAAAAFTLDAERLLDDLVESASRQAEHADAAVLLVSKSARELRLARVRGAAWNMQIGTVFPFDGALAGWVAESNEVHGGAVPDKRPTLAVEHPFVRRFGGVALPMIVHARLLGVLIFRKPEGRAATPGQIKALGVLAAIAAAAIAAAMLHEHVKDAEERYRTLFEGDPIPTWVIEQDTQRFIAVNEAAVRNYGWSREEFLAMPVLDLFWPPEDRERMRTLIVERRSGSDPEAAYRGQWRHRRKNGEILDIMAESRAIRFAGRECRIVTAVDISDRLAAEARLATLSRRVLEVQETERREVARELHDEIGQALTAVKLSMDALRRAPGARVDTAAYADTVELVDNALQQVRSLTLNLRPAVLDDLGLAPALRWLVARQKKLAGTRLEADIDLPETRLDPTIETACFRIAQEAITNSLRHARPQRISLSIRVEDGAVTMSVTDDGSGFDLAAARALAAQGHSAGLTGMEERAHLAGGQFEVRAAPGDGTEVRARFALRSTA